MLKEIVIAVESFFRAHQFICSHKLWKWIIIPGVLYMLLFVSGIVLLFLGFLLTGTYTVAFTCQAGNDVAPETVPPEAQVTASITSEV